MQQKLSYILSLFKKNYPSGDINPEIGYGSESPAKIRIRHGDTTYFTEKRFFIPDTSKIKWVEWKNVRIPFFFDVNHSEIFSRKNDYFIINYDIIASAFFLLSSWNEYFSDKKDKYGRFPYSESIQSTIGITGIPVVNYYFDILKTVIEEAYDVTLSPLKWNDKDFATCLTHDIDTCETGWLQGGFHAIKKGKIMVPLRLILKKLFFKDIWFNFNEIIDIEKTFKARSTFFFLWSDTKKEGIKNADYIASKKKFQFVFSEIENAGSEIGLHASATTHKDQDRFEQELERIHPPVKGVRFHFLLYDHRITPYILEKSGMKFDSTLGFAEQYGFRNSFCLPFQPYDIVNDRPFNFYEIPLIVMDSTIQKYMPVSKEDALTRISSLINEVKQFHGCFTVLWHNTHFSSYKYEGWKEVYIQILEKCIHENTSFLTCSEIIKCVSDE